MPIFSRSAVRENAGFSWIDTSIFLFTCEKGLLEIGTLLPNNQRQHRTLHIQEEVLPNALCW